MAIGPVQGKEVAQESGGDDLSDVASGLHNTLVPRQYRCLPNPACRRYPKLPENGFARMGNSPL